MKIILTGLIILLPVIIPIMFLMNYLSDSDEVKLEKLKIKEKREQEKKEAKKQKELEKSKKKEEKARKIQEAKLKKAEELAEKTRRRNISYDKPINNRIELNDLKLLPLYETNETAAEIIDEIISVGNKVVKHPLVQNADKSLINSFVNQSKELLKVDGKYFDITKRTINFLNLIKLEFNELLLSLDTREKDMHNVNLNTFGKLFAMKTGKSERETDFVSQKPKALPQNEVPTIIDDLVKQKDSVPVESNLQYSPKCVDKSKYSSYWWNEYDEEKKKNMNMYGMGETEQSRFYKILSKKERAAIRYGKLVSDLRNIANIMNEEMVYRQLSENNDENIWERLSDNIKTNIIEKINKSKYGEVPPKRDHKPNPYGIFREPKNKTIFHPLPNDELNKSMSKLKEEMRELRLRLKQNLSE